MLKDTGRRFETEELNEFSLDGFMMERVQPTCRVSNPRWPIRTGGGIGTVTSAQSAAGVFSQGTHLMSFLFLHCTASNKVMQRTRSLDRSVPCLRCIRIRSRALTPWRCD